MNTRIYVRHRQASMHANGFKKSVNLKTYRLKICKSIGYGFKKSVNFFLQIFKTITYRFTDFKPIGFYIRNR